VNGEAVNEAVNLTLTGVDNVETISIAAYPTPFTDRLTITGKAGVAGRYTITSIIGTVMGSGPLTGERTELSLSQLRSGVYLLQVNLNGRVQTFRMVKE